MELKWKLTLVKNSDINFENACDIQIYTGNGFDTDIGVETDIDTNYDIVAETDNISILTLVLMLISTFTSIFMLILTITLISTIPHIHTYTLTYILTLTLPLKFAKLNRLKCTRYNNEKCVTQ